MKINFLLLAALPAPFQTQPHFTLQMDPKLGWEEALLNTLAGTTLFHFS